MEPAPEQRHLRVLAWAAVAALALAVLVLIPNAVTIALVGLAGVILGVYLRALSNLLGKAVRVPHAALLSAVVLAHAMLLTFFLVWAVPNASEELAVVRRELPQAWAGLQTQIESTWLGDVMAVLPSVETILSEVPSLRARILGVFSSTLAGLVALALILVTGLFLAWAPERYVRGVLSLVRPRRRARVREVLDELYTTMSRWVLGRTLSALIIGVAVGISLAVLGVPLPGVIGVIAAALSYIPNIGAVLTVIPAVLLALTKGVGTAAAVFITYLVVQLVETQLLTPLIERWAVRVPPALLLIVQAMLGVVTGLVGVALAAPLIAIAMVLLKRLYVEDRLEGPSEVAHGPRMTVRPGDAPCPG